MGVPPKRSIFPSNLAMRYNRGAPSVRPNFKFCPREDFTEEPHAKAFAESRDFEIFGVPPSKRKIFDFKIPPRKSRGYSGAPAAVANARVRRTSGIKIRAAKADSPDPAGLRSAPIKKTRPAPRKAYQKLPRPVAFRSSARRIPPAIVPLRTRRRAPIPPSLLRCPFLKRKTFSAAASIPPQALRPRRPENG